MSRLIISVLIAVLLIGCGDSGSSGGGGGTPTNTAPWIVADDSYLAPYPAIVGVDVVSIYVYGCDYEGNIDTLCLEEYDAAWQFTGLAGCNSFPLGGNPCELGKFILGVPAGTGVYYYKVWIVDTGNLASSAVYFEASYID